MYGLPKNDLVYVSSPGSVALYETLQEVMVPLIDLNTCQVMQESAGSTDHIQYDQICAGYKEGGKDSCQVSDTKIIPAWLTFSSGGPLHRKQKQCMTSVFA